MCHEPLIPYLLPFVTLPEPVLSRHTTRQRARSGANLTTQTTETPGVTDATAATAVPPAPTCESFDELGLLPELLRAVIDNGYTKPTPIQAQAIPIIMAGSDVMGGAQTGTGKTAGFTLPLLQRLAKHASSSRWSEALPKGATDRCRPRRSVFVHC